MEIERQLKLLTDRDVIVRRGRNNRVMMKFIERKIFEDEDLLDQKKVLGKRHRPSKIDALSYLEEEFPGVSEVHKACLLNDRDFYRNHLRKMNHIRVSSINEEIIS